jgi:hypothetical protein
MKTLSDADKKRARHRKKDFLARSTTTKTMSNAFLHATAIPFSRNRTTNHGNFSLESLKNQPTIPKRARHFNVCRCQFWLFFGILDE